MRYDRAAILSDLDGTLFNSRGEVSPADRAAIREFQSRGGIFTVATGRAPSNAGMYLPDLDLNGPGIVLNGAGIFDFESRRYLHTVRIDRQAAEDTLRYCLSAGLPLDLQVYTTDGIFYASPTETAQPEFLRIHQPTCFLPMDLLHEKEWLKTLLLERSPGALAPMRAYLKRMGYDRRLSLVEGTTDVVHVGEYEELLPLHVHKGSAVGVLRTLDAYQGRVLFAAGDYLNDLEMLRAVDVPCAPASAIPEVRQICRWILPSNNESPIAALIRRLRELPEP